MTKKCILAILFCLMLASSFAAIGLVTVQANPEFPWDGDITLYAMISSDLPYATWSGGYHDIVYELQKWLADIGINLEIRMYDSWTVWSTCWEEYYNVSSDVAKPPDGWDLTTSDWWVGVTSTIWQESFLLKEAVPPSGFNIMSYTNDDADDLLAAGIHTVDAEERRDNLWDWQEEFMHDPPMINLFYPFYYDVCGAYVEGWSANVWFGDLRYLRLNEDEMPENRKALGTNTFRVGCCDEMTNVMTLYQVGYTQLAYNVLTQLSLYTAYADYNETAREFIDGTWTVTPELAADLPIFMEGPNGPYTMAIVPLKDDIWWVWGNETQSEKFDAGDVVWSIEAVLDPFTGSPSTYEWIPAIESVGVASNATLIDLGLHPDVGGEIYEPYAVQINLTAQYPDLTGLLSIIWGAGILPEHLLGGISHSALKYSDYNSDPSLWCFNGPYLFDTWEKDEWIRVKRNPYYTGDVPVDLPEYVILEIIPDDTVRNLKLQQNQLDGLEFTWADVSQIYEWDSDVYPYLRAMKYEASQSNNIMFNLNNPFLSNRYVRLAIAHAINYDDIASRILPGWGIDTVAKGKATICPHTYYTEPDVPGSTDPVLNGTTVNLFNEDLEPYEYNLTKAVKYMEMWYYSQVGTDWTQGPVGDGDFSGEVGIPDYTIFANSIVEGTLTPPWPRPPGNDIDPDYDNDEEVMIYDYYRWGNFSDYYYPERSPFRSWGR